jgi:hypothetical protein
MFRLAKGDFLCTRDFGWAAEGTTANYRREHPRPELDLRALKESALWKLTQT